MFAAVQVATSTFAAAQLVLVPPIVTAHVFETALPTVSLMSPPFPPMDFPVTKEIEPELPEEVVPVLNESVPETPASPASRVFKIILPLLVFVPRPEANSKLPPVPSTTAEDVPAFILIVPPSEVVDVPASILMAPPFPVSPVPILTVKSPLLPPMASPVTTLNLPESPNVAEPDSNANVPETPATPASEVFTSNAPDEVASDLPVTNLIKPPLNISVSPAVNLKSPPGISFDIPFPTDNLISPPLPLLAFPVDMEINPELP